MSIATDLKRCPQCGGAMQCQFDCGTTEEIRVCLCCGFSQQWYLLRDGRGAIKTDEKGGWLGGYFEAVRYGVSHLQDERGSITFDVFEEPLPEAVRRSWAAMDRSRFPGSESYVTAYDPLTGKLSVLYGRLPVILRTVQIILIF